MTDLNLNASQRSEVTAGQSLAIELIGINKRFGAVHANKEIDLAVTRGTIHGIVGENGAGKSTLMSILYGFYHADSGKILGNGKEVTINNSSNALSLGIGMVHQHFMLVDNFTVLENVILGAEDSALLRPSLEKARKELHNLSETYGLSIPPDAIVETLSVGQQQRVEILKALYRGAEVLILDEPTGVLTPAEADHLFKVLDTLRAQGKTVILITHKLREIMHITDTVSVMRQGTMVSTLPTSQTSPEALAELMVGRRVLLRVQKELSVPGDVLLEVDNIHVADDMHAERVSGMSFKIRAGEILGIAGVAGNGQSELLEAIAGMRAITSGTIKLNGQPVRFENDESAADFRRKGLAHVPEDRLRMGLVTNFMEWENAILGYQDDKRYGASILLDRKAAQKEAQRHIEKFDIRPNNTKLKSANFSGGNQQKIVLAREMERDPDVLIVGQPTRGVDIGAIEFIHNQIIKMRDAGKAILLVSVELDEIRSLSDRIIVVCGGRIMGEVDPATTTEAELGLLMAGVAQTSSITTSQQLPTSEVTS